MLLERPIVRSLAFAIVLALVAPSSAARAAEPYELDAVLSQTGTAAFLGTAETETLGVVQDFVNRSGGIAGRPLKIVVQDDQSNPQLAVQLVNALIAKKVAVFIGPTITAACGAVLALLKDGPADYCLSPGVHPSAGSYMFSAAYSTVDALAALVHYMRARGWTKIAMITSSDATGQDAERNADAALALPQNRGMTLVAREHFNVGDLSVAAQMAHVKGSGAQVLIAWATGTPFGTLVRGIHDAGLDIPVASSNGNLTYAQLKQYGPFLPKEIIFAGIPSSATAEQLPRGPTKAAVTRYVDAFKAAGTRVEVGEYQAWDPAWIVVAALRKLGPDASAEQIRAYIAGLRGFVGVNGPYDFRAIPQRGIGMSAVDVVRWDEAKDVWVAVSKPGGDPLK